MMIFFIISLVASMWKIYAFLPNKELADDDTTEASQEELKILMLKVIKSSDANLKANDLYKKMRSDKDFDEKHFWRFNQNRLNQLLNQHYLENPDVFSIEDIYKTI
ncbi:hypothetical protein [Sulfurimonas sp.]|uniref:hypothetical protein n=1 Tax=Sulfurimonas sp. TaxID=2022749 RepID=UPI002AB2F933|nr:hypothetical protein [Sulfurimonas sp.]